METEQYVTLHSGTADNHHFTTTFNRVLTFGDGWEVAVAQVHLPSGPFKWLDAFKQQFSNNPVLGQLKIYFKTSASDESTSANKQKSVRLNDILGQLSETTSKFDMLKLIYTWAWNGIMEDLQKDRSFYQVYHRMNDVSFMPQVLKETSRGLKLDGTSSFGGYLALNKTLAQMIGVLNATGTGLGSGVQYVNDRGKIDMKSLTTYVLSGDQVLLSNNMRWYFPTLTSQDWPSLPNTTPPHVDIHCDAVKPQQSNGQILLHATGTMIPSVRSYVTLTKTEVQQIKVWIMESGTSTLATFPHEKTRITLHFRKKL